MGEQRGDADREVESEEYLPTLSVESGAALRAGSAHLLEHIAAFTDTLLGLTESVTDVARAFDASGEMFHALERWKGLASQHSGVDIMDHEGDVDECDDDDSLDEDTAGEGLVTVLARWTFEEVAPRTQGNAPFREKDAYDTAQRMAAALAERGEWAFDLQGFSPVGGVRLIIVSADDSGAVEGEGDGPIVELRGPVVRTALRAGVVVCARDQFDIF
ncbi:hypothetical protein [Pseudokineococcus sp. 1T1Z-3]|uniref:hypothetical protein n=1 Tax=Pseudokineococcus sp. 1T1Z-3 TaxID=3132745 RepID=UPI003099C14A